jgi:uncharacterized protein
MPNWVLWVPIWGAVGCAGGVPSAAPLSAATAAPEPSTAQPASAGNATARAATSAQAPKNQKPTPTRSREALLERSCELGSALGCNDLGVLVWADEARSLPFLERACELGLLRGCTNLGVMLAHDASKHDRAVELLDDGCMKSDPLACAKLGDILYAEPEATRPLSKAEASYERACQLEQADACIGAGWMQLRGEGTEKSSERAEESFKFACDHDNFRGCAGLGFVLIGRANNAAEVEQGTHWLRVACDHDSGFGCFMLANRIATENQRLTAEARELLSKACRLGVKPACAASTAPDEPAKAPAPEKADDEDD